VRQRYSSILSHTGLLLIPAAVLMLTPLAAVIGRPSEYRAIPAFAFPSLALCLCGLALWRFFRLPEARALTTQEGGVIVLLGWTIVFLISALPLMLILECSFPHALFESVSGWTTTGLSVIDVEGAPRSVILWRSVMQLAGGAGLAIIMLAAITGPPGAGLYVAEGRSEQLAPHVRHSVRLVITLYAAYASAGFLMYRWAGMSTFDAMNHSFAAVSTGGFSSRTLSIGYWNSFAVEAVTLPLMVAGNANFLAAYMLFSGRPRAAWRSPDSRIFLLLAPLGAALLYFLACKGVYGTAGADLRVALFQAVSALTTTGFSTVGFADWNGAGFLILIFLMLVGGGACSTAGGIKQYRIYMLYKALVWELKRPFLPRQAQVENFVWQGERKDFVSDNRLHSVAVFCFVYAATITAGTTIVTACGFPLRESLFEFTSALGTVGLSTGITGPTAPAPVIWAEILGMFFGRLEFFVIVVSLWKIVADSKIMLRIPARRSP